MLMPLISWMLFGLFIGAIARLLYPGRQDIGLFRTMLLGVAGSFVGGFVVYLFSGGASIQAAGWIGSMLGAIAVLAVAMRRQSSHS
ncbi:putative membrane protein YeaQ/YmgE (transglycosylase-associated protein family) [Rhodopirellula rubra]|uniref:Putative membrane protein YeaQ/YmgE (Transglycosylase-associated protein family) n=1 Tax=Aporhodopirellula rubra TaxID=980271 RepID=A0A7W5H6I4_9BACT|nr:GlsB/YeaQ/YmgE family stress response membrane protein [Aporhodopirellula rubra]MBB3206995.1 putative membrane protein YeaQ/YmgE (transglycosylase-associated protein family) [Aporhodopirellula rubra]